MPILGGGLIRARISGFILDSISNVAAAYSLRKLRTAYAGSACKVRRSSDNAEQDIGFTGSGDFDTSAFNSFIGGGSGFVKTWYDQSGNGRDATQATAGNQPSINTSGLNSKPVVAFASASTQYLSTSTWTGIAQPFTSVFCARSNGNAINTDYFYDATSSSNRVLAGRKLDGSTANQFGLYAGSSVVSVTDAALSGASIIFSCLYNGSSSQLWTNGNSRATGNPGTNQFASLKIATHNSAASNTLNGHIADLLIVAGLSIANHNSIGNNMATYYGLSWTAV